MRSGRWHNFGCHSRSRSRLPHRNRELEKVKSDMAIMRNDITTMGNKLNMVEQRVIRNEAHSRSRNIRIYGLTKPTDRQADLKPIFKEVLSAGLKLSPEIVQNILNSVDLLHFTDDAALMVAFCKRSDRGLVLKHCKNLADYKPYGKSISFNVDLTKEAYTEKKNRDKKFSDYKATNQGANIKKISFDKIMLDGEILHYSKVVIHSIVTGANAQSRSNATANTNSGPNAQSGSSVIN